MTYTKLMGTITDSTIWREPDTTRIVWITMLAMADQNGVVGAALPGLADRARVSIENTIAALETFKSPDKWSRSQEYDGRRIAEVDGGWVLLNHAKHRAATNAEDRKEAAKLGMRKLRERLKADEKTLEPVNTVKEPCAELRQEEAKAHSNTKEEKKKTRSAQARPPAAQAVPVEVLVEAGFPESLAEEFIDYKTAKKAPLTARAWADHQSQCVKAGWSAVAAAEKVMAKGWKGFEATYVQDRGGGGIQNANGGSETPWQRSQRLMVAQMTGGRVSARDPNESWPVLFERKDVFDVIATNLD